MRFALATTLASGLVTAALAGGKDLSVSVHAYRSGAVDGGGIAGPNVYSADFEAPAYAVGALNAQNGWLQSINGTQWTVANVNPGGGLQHARNAKNPALGTGQFQGIFSPDAGALPPGPSIFSVDVNISATGGADYDVVVQSPAQTFITARVKFFFADADGDTIPGDIAVVDDADGPGPGGLALVATGAEYAPGVYKNLRIEADPTVDTLKYFYDGVLIYENPLTGLFAGTTMEQVVIFSDNFHNPGETGDFDNVQVSEPVSCLGGLGDANCDGGVDFFDIDPFLLALFDNATYLGSFCGGSNCAADTDCSGGVDFFDIDPFLTCLFNGCPPCPT